MSKFIFKNGQTSNIIRVFIPDTTSVIGGGKTGLTFSSSGLIISTIADNEAAATTYTQAGSTIETITTLGTFAAPTATKCRFKELDSANFPGVYEIQIADARFAVSNARSLIISLPPVTGLGIGAVRAEIQLTAFDFQTATQPVNVTIWNGTTVATPATAGIPDVNAKNIANQATSAAAGITFPSSIASPTNITAGTIANVTNDVGITQTAADKVWNTASRTLTSFGTLIADVWAYATRILTAGTNIALAKGVGLTGLNDISAAQVNTEADAALSDAGVNTVTMAHLDADVSSRSTLTATQVWAFVITNGYTAAQLIRGIVASLFGKVHGASGVHPGFRNLADTKDTIATTVDSVGNRTVITLDLDE